MYVYVTEEPNLLRENTVYITKECLFQLLWYVHEENVYMFYEDKTYDIFTECPGIVLYFS